MKNELTEGVKVLNIVIQSFLSLIFDILVSLGLSWLLVEKLGAPRWCYVIIILVGVLVGVLSMLKFILTATGNMDKIERDKKREMTEREKKERKQRELRDFFKNDKEREEQ